MTRRRCERAFTLLELVLAMSLLVLVSAVCYAAFHLGIRAVAKGEVAVVMAQRLRVASDVLIRQIKSTVAYPARNRDLDVYPYFVGTATSMTFITAAGQLGGGGLTRIVYQVMDNPPRLVMSESKIFSPDSLGSEDVAPVDAQSAVLLDGFRNLKFEYLLNDGADLEWRPVWDGHEEEILPSAVRVTVEGMPGLETDIWGQEIPIMTTNYGDSVGEVGDEDLQEPSDEQLDEEGGDGQDGSDAGIGDPAELGDGE
jgi:type II secretory pathway pseudopilin PulG